MLAGELLRKSARLYRDNPFIFYNDLTLTYGQFNERVNRLANFMRSKGIGRGDRIALLMKNSPKYLEAYFAGAKVGAVAVTLNPRLHIEEYRYMLEDSEPRVVIMEDAFLGVAESTRNMGLPIDIFVSTAGGIEGFEDYDKIIEESSSEEPRVSIEEDDPIQFIYCNAQSGFPRAAILTHRNLTHTGMTIVMGGHFYIPETKVLLTVPLFHIGPMVITIGVICMGKALNIKREFIPQLTITALSEERCTHTFLVPAMIQSLFTVDNVEKRDYSHLKYILYGSAPMHEHILKRAMDIFRCQFLQGYGLTESTGVLGLLQPEDHKTHWHATCRECLSAELRIINENGEEIKPGGEVGEIIARGPGIMKGYWKSPEETKRVFYKGWLRTGDLAHIDEEGYITLVDRSKDMIIKGGENVFPAEIERVISMHQAVRRCGVIAIPDKIWGEEIMALIELKEGLTLTEKEIRQFIRGYLSSFKIPKVIEFRQSLPLKRDGSINKRALREEFWQGYEKRIN
jgi:acyl-CoA synthetase (AMP-forming)/AMP-acid ligase II